MIDDGGERPARVVLLHGLNAGPWMLWPMARALRRDRFIAETLGYRSRDWTFERIVETLLRKIEASAGDEQVHLVGHSMGGLVAQALAARLPAGKVGRMVMLAPPAGGSEWVDLLRRIRIDRLAMRHAVDALAPDRDPAVTAMLGSVGYPLGVIAGNRHSPLERNFLPFPHDGRVSVAATHVAGESDHIVMPVSHTAMVWNADVQRQVIAFLRIGRFEARTGSDRPIPARSLAAI